MFISVNNRWGSQPTNERSIGSKCRFPPTAKAVGFLLDSL
ncbi:hypothetical protein HSB1_34130 [Halogranum salarium B-1]|uniref:Uncharacterized protein n=1 Tax=Halogranum salarium B-1 TaxID=1210908 RepID=J3JE25_9EURY|nr:hypothetical protein HSB1_34130 [Halogranum salarium B-1]